MTKKEIIEQIQDKLGEGNTNLARQRYHPQIIAYTCDQYYRQLLAQAYSRNPFSLSGSLERVMGVDVYEDDNSGYLFSVVPKRLIPFFSSNSGVFGVERVSDSTVKFEPYGSAFEKRNWQRLFPNFATNVRFWVKETVDPSIISSSASLISKKTIVWFDAPSTKLTSSDKVNMELLTSFVEYDNDKKVVIPSAVGDVGQLISYVYNDLLQKLGLQAEKQEQEQSENNE